MINTKSAATLGLAVLATFACAATAQEQWTKMTAIYCKMELAKDGKGMTKIIKSYFSPDLKYIPLTGPVINRDGFIKNELEQLKMADKITKAVINMTHFVTNGNTATSDCDFHIAADLKVPKGEKPMKLTADGTMKFKYALKNGIWWATEMKEVTNKVLINGKPIGAPTVAPKSH